MSKYGIQHSNDILVFQGRAGGKVVGQGQVNDSEVALCALSTKVSKHEHENDQYATQVTNFVTCLSLFPKPRAIRRPYVLFYVLFPDGPKVFKRRSYVILCGTSSECSLPILSPNFTSTFSLLHEEGGRRRSFFVHAGIGERQV